MAISNKPLQYVCIYDPLADPFSGGATENQDYIAATSVRDSMSPDVSAPSEYFFGGDGQRTIVRADTSWGGDFADQDEMKILSEWLLGTEVNAIGLGPGRCMQWIESTPLELRAGGLRYDTLRAELYSGKLSPTIYNYSDLLLGFGWADGDSDGVFDGYTQAGTETATIAVSGDTATVTIASAGNDDLQYYVDIICPFPSLTYTFGINVVSTYSGAVATEQAKIIQYDDQGVAGTTNTVEIGTTGEKAISITNADSDVYVFRVYPIDLQTVSGAGNIQVKRPTLTVSGF